MNDIDAVQPPVAIPKKKIIYSFDIAKFCLAVMVVQLHTSGYNLPLSRLAVPLFFVISSYLFFSKYQTIPNGVAKVQCLWHFMQRICFLYTFWFIIQLPYIYMVRKVFFDDLLKGDFRLFLLILFNSTFIGSWFLSALLVGMAVVCVLFWIFPKVFVGVLGFVIYCFCQMAQFNFPTPGCIQYLFHLLSYLTVQPAMSFLTAIIFIVIGKFIAEYEKKHIISNKLLLWIVFVLGSVVISENLIHSRYYCFWSNIIVTLPLCYAIVELLLRFPLNDLSPRAAGVSSTLRKMSIIIYCCHGGIACFWRFSIYNITGKNAIVRFSIYPLTLMAALIVAFVILSLQKTKYFKWLKYVC